MSGPPPTSGTGWPASSRRPRRGRRRPGRALDALLADDRAERARLAEAERAATSARERLRAADDRARAADVAVAGGPDLAGRPARAGARRARRARRGRAPAPRGRRGRGRRRPGRRGGEGRRCRGGLGRAPGRRAADAEPESEGDAAPIEAALERLVPSWTAEAPAGEAPTPGRLATLRRRFHELGAANPFAIDEYRSVKERLETLDAQDRDLRDAIARTRSLIADLDALIATQFRTTFAALEVAFDARFHQLFGGGFAQLILTDPTDLGSTGIEITARPPGKKPQALAMLSGGERALTAVALLFAMLEVRPAPFCVLDEVDAALDEANVGRFTEALRELAERTQFIVITHNRGTIESADALYGVTVGDDSVSRVISLRLDEAQAIAGRRRTEASPVLGGAG